MLQDYYNTGDDGYNPIYGVFWEAMTFTTTSAYSIGSVKLKMFKLGTPVGLMTVGIRAVSGGAPTGGDLTSGTIDPATFTTNTSGDWYEITFGSSYSLSASTQYAIVVRQPGGGNSTNAPQWRKDSSSPTYTNGNREYSTNSGSSWLVSSDDYMFETYSSATVYAEGTKIVTAAGTITLVTDSVTITEGTKTVTAAASISFDTESYKSNTGFPSARPSDFNGDLYWHETTGTWTSTRTQIAGAWAQHVVAVSEQGEVYFRSI